MTFTTNSTPFSDLETGMHAESNVVCDDDQLIALASVTRNQNPIYLPKQSNSEATQSAVPSALYAGLIASLIGNQLPGPGSRVVSQALTIEKDAYAGDELIVRVEIIETLADHSVRLATQITCSKGHMVANGEARVIAPTKSTTTASVVLPGVTVQRHRHFERLLEQARPLPPMRTAVIAPETEDALSGALLGMDNTLISPVLIGDRNKIKHVAQGLGRDLAGIEIVDQPDHAAAAAAGVMMVREGTANAIMKGHLHTDVLLKAVVSSEGGLRTKRRLSHVFVMDVPGFDRMLHITDGAINIEPDLTTKIDIVQNAIDLAHAIGQSEPRVAILSAVEKVNPAINSTLEAAALSKMAERGQIKGGIVDGPLAMDNAIDLDAARTKGITSPVAGLADILVAPNMETGNMLAKELIFAANAKTGGLVVGARCPVILTSRADDEVSRLASCAIAVLQNRWMSSR